LRAAGDEPWSGAGGDRPGDRGVCPMPGAMRR
jgi:hypothetical protein